MKKHAKHSPELLIIDSFCGAGGVTEGFEKAEIDGQKIAMVIVGINHDKLAIESHMANHPETLHFVEDMRTLNLDPVINKLNEMKLLYPNAKVIFHASLECTNFSRAKGGMARDADSRTLAEHLYRYVESLDPDYITIENVTEFMSWGPLDNKGKPVSRDNGKSWTKWRKKINQYGYYDQWVQMNSANYGAYTSRNRLFGMFAKHDLPIVFPQATHSKNTAKELFASLEKWKPVREVLELDDKGNSIFERKKDLSEKTLQRIYAGLIKFIAGGKDAFLLKYNSINKQTGKHVPPSIDEPCPTIAVQARLGVVQPQFIVQRNSGEPSSKVYSIEKPARTVTSTGGNQEMVSAEFIMKYFSGKPEGKVISIEGPAGTIKTIDGQAIVSPEFIAAYYGEGGGQLSSIDKPGPTITTKDRHSIIQPEFFVNYHHSSKIDSLNKPCPTLTCKDKLAVCQPQFIYRNFKTATNQSIDSPAGSLTTEPKMSLLSAVPFIMDTQFNNVGKNIDEPMGVITANRKHHYIVNPSWVGNVNSVDEPCPVVIARQDKSPLYLVTSTEGKPGILIFETDSEYTKKIKEFMAIYGIIDIKMRMLKVKELMKIQGFPDNYVLKGSQAHQKKFIGNSVVPIVIKKWSEALVIRLTEIREYKIAV